MLEIKGKIMDKPKMTQEQLEFLHNHLMEHLQQYASGLYMLPEFIRCVGEVGKAMDKFDDESFRDLIDPSTGLRYCTL
jgi:hypothetical protein